MSVQSYWATHTAEAAKRFLAGQGIHHPLDARRCTVQLSTGRLYLDVVASPATALLGHDLPPMPAADAPTVQQMLSSLATGYVCRGMMENSSAAADLAVQMAPLAAGGDGRIVETNSLDGEPSSGSDFLIVHENETLGRSGHWLASSAWRRAPELVVVGEVIALGHPFGAVLARSDLAWNVEFVRGGAAPAPNSATLARVAAAITTVASEGLLQHGRDLADYLMGRLDAMRSHCPQIESLEAGGLAVRIAFTPPLGATEVRRRMCERGVLAGVDRAGRLAIDPPLPLRIAEADVITGALRGALLDLPLVGAPACCPACKTTTE